MAMEVASDGGKISEAGNTMTSQWCTFAIDANMEAQKAYMRLVKCNEILATYDVTAGVSA